MTDLTWEPVTDGKRKAFRTVREDGIEFITHHYGGGWYNVDLVIHGERHHFRRAYGKDAAFDSPSLFHFDTWKAEEMRKAERDRDSHQRMAAHYANRLQELMSL